MSKIVLFASGSGTNVENIVRYFQSNSEVEITFVFTNKKDARVLERCKELEVSAAYLSKEALKSKAFLDMLQQLNPELIGLAGYLLKIPEPWISAFQERIINIHPALLPKYGGKGMYGAHVHEAVIAAREKESGITIHYVNEHYDEGAIIAQYALEVSPQDTPLSLAEKIHGLEHEYYPKVIEKLLAHAD